MWQSACTALPFTHLRMPQYYNVYGTNEPRRGIISRLRGTIHSFTPFERLLFLILVCMALGSLSVLIWRANAAFMVEIPAQGGMIREGAIGTPRFINPLLAESDVDKDLSSLIFASLLDRSEDGTLSGELAASYSVSEDGKTYHFTLKPDLTFHDGTPLTSKDVVFTVKLAQDASIESPYRVDFAGVVATALSPREIEFTLPSPYTPFIENMTIGILPSHIWESAQPEEVPLSHFNIEPIGSGPYKIETINRDSSGIATGYELSSFKNYARGEAHIGTIDFTFFRNEPELIQALTDGTVNAASNLSPQLVSAFEGDGVHTVFHGALPRTFGVFFNYNRLPIFAKTEVRKALGLYIDRQAVIEAALSGYGVAVSEPFYTPDNEVAFDRERAELLLQNGGWTKKDNHWVHITKEEESVLSFTISTADVPELVRAADEVARQWREFGAEVEIATFAPADLAQNVIRPRKFDALLFGLVVGRETDLYPFWHSSQRNDPGLNIAAYTNIDADHALEVLRDSLSESKRAEALTTFRTETEKDAPAAFLFAPELVYVLPADVQNVSLINVANPSDRFSTVSSWYVNTDTVWPFLEDVFNR